MLIGVGQWNVLQIEGVWGMGDPQSGVKLFWVSPGL